MKGSGLHSSSRCRERFHALARLALLSCNFLSGQAQRGRGAGPKGHSSEVVKARKVHPREKLASEWRQVVTRRWRSSLPLPQTHAEDVGSGAALTTSGTLCIPRGLNWPRRTREGQGAGSEARLGAGAEAVCERPVTPPAPRPPAPVPLQQGDIPEGVPPPAPAPRPPRPRERKTSPHPSGCTARPGSAPVPW